MRFRLSELRQIISEAASKAYQILGLNTNATPEEIKAAYRRKAIELHPDRNKDADAPARMVRLNVAYGLLSDPEKRRKYDSVGDKTLGDHIASGWAPPPPPRPRPSSYSAGPPPPPPPPRKGPIPNPASNKDAGSTAGTRYFAKSDGKSNKFWQIERNRNSVIIRFGRIGTEGHRIVKTFPDEYSTMKFVRTIIRQKLDRGYHEKTSSYASNAAPPPAQKKAAPPPPRDSQYAEREARRRREQQRKKAAATPPPGSTGKDTYKIYGKRGNAPASTRYKSKVYVAPSDTKFRNGDRANVGLGTDGRLSVHNPKTNHTQSWYAEALGARIADLIIEVIDNSNMV